MTNVPHKLQLRLWGKAAGRCQYAGCNKPLWLDSLTKVEFNIAYAAHIIADKPPDLVEIKTSLKSSALISQILCFCAMSTIGS